MQWKMPSEHESKPVIAASYELNPGVIDLAGNQVQHPSRIWVDGTLIVAVGFFAMQIALAAVTEAFLLCWENLTQKNRQCPLTMDKWAKLIVAEEQLGLGLIFNTRKMSVAITSKYLNDSLRSMQTIWSKDSPHKNGIKRFTAI